MANDLTQAPPSPSAALAQHIVQQLREKRLIAPHDPAQFARDLSEGKLRESDWKAALELQTSNSKLLPAVARSAKEGQTSNSKLQTSNHATPQT